VFLIDGILMESCTTGVRMDTGYGIKGGYCVVILALHSFSMRGLYILVLTNVRYYSLG